MPKKERNEYRSWLRGVCVCMCKSGAKRKQPKKKQELLKKESEEHKKNSTKKQREKTILKIQDIYRYSPYFTWTLFSQKLATD